MPQGLSGLLGTILGTPGAGGQGGTPGLAGGLTGLMGAISQFSLAAKQKQALDRSLWYAKNPGAISQLQQQFTQPLSQGLVKGTENVVNASLAEQGLSQAPGQQSQVLAQALAPYQQQEQQMALTEALKAIGLPAEALQSLQGIMNPQQLAMMLKGVLPGQPQSPTQTPPYFPSGGASASPSPGITVPSGGGSSDPSGAGDLDVWNSQ